MPSSNFKQPSKRTVQRHKNKEHPAIPNGTRVRRRTYERLESVKELLDVDELGLAIDAVVAHGYPIIKVKIADMKKNDACDTKARQRDVHSLMMFAANRLFNESDD